MVSRCKYCGIDINREDELIVIVPNQWVPSGVMHHACWKEEQQELEKQRAKDLLSMHDETMMDIAELP